MSASLRLSWPLRSRSSCAWLGVVAGLGLVGCEDSGTVMLRGDSDDTGATRDSDPADTADSGASGGTCDEGVAFQPYDGADEVMPGAPVRATFTTPVPAAERGAVSLRVRSGNTEVPGVLAWDEAGTEVTFEPLQGLTSGTEHTLLFSAACGTAQVGFTTMEPVWRIGFGTATQDAPPVGQVDVRGAFGTMLMRLDAASRDDVELTFAAALGSSQDACGVTASGTMPRSDDAVGTVRLGTGTMVVDGGPEPVGTLSFDLQLDAASGRVSEASVFARVPCDALASALGGNPCGAVNTAPCPGTLLGNCMRVELSDLDVGASQASVVPVGPQDTPSSCDP